MSATRDDADRALRLITGPPSPALSGGTGIWFLDLQPSVAGSA
ncbi:hypothetical protein [Virgisporangium ochraceum]|nr:hypothetical protein [Virgisporangium ochraceum]